MINKVLPTIAGVDPTERGEEELSILEGVCWNTRLMSPRMTSDIIECDGWLVVKLYSLGIPREVVDREVRLTNIARSLDHRPGGQGSGKRRGAVGLLLRED